MHLLLRDFEMSNIKGAIGHLRTINRHRRLVRKHCFRIGLIRQGLMHDLSKYSPSEFIVGAKYFQGTRSPNNAEREAIGYSSAWLHHKGRNKHHYEYWIDYNVRGKDPDAPVLIPVEMPKKYLAEMIMDRIAASKVYCGKNYKDDDSLKYFLSGIEKAPMHPNTSRDLEFYLRMLADKGEKETFKAIRQMLKEDKKNGRA